jgi:hypothetical protein
MYFSTLKTLGKSAAPPPCPDKILVALMSEVVEHI